MQRWAGETGTTVNRWTGGAGGTVAGAPMIGGLVIHRHRCMPYSIRTAEYGNLAFSSIAYPISGMHVYA